MDVKLACINYPIRNDIAQFLRFFSSHSMDRTISLGEYLGNLKPTQRHIYYIGADSLASARSIPCVQRLIEQDIEVKILVFLEMISDHMVVFTSSSAFLVS